MDDIDKLLNKITKDYDYGIAIDLFALQGNPHLNFFEVKKIEDLYSHNMGDFILGEQSQSLTIAISNNQDELWRLKDEVFEKGSREFNGNIFLDKSVRIVEGEPLRNELHITTIEKLYEYNQLAYNNRLDRNWHILAIVKDAKSAKAHIDTIRVMFRKENPKIKKTK